MGWSIWFRDLGKACILKALRTHLMRLFWPRFLKSNIEGTPALFVLNPVSDFLGFLLYLYEQSPDEGQFVLHPSS